MQCYISMDGQSMDKLTSHTMAMEELAVTESCLRK